MTVEIPRQRGDAGSLSARERAILDFEREWWTYAGAKDVAVRSAFGLTREDYDVELDQLLARPAALLYDSATVLRLARQRQPRNGWAADER